MNVLGTGSCTVCQCQGCAYERKEAVSILRAAQAPAQQADSHEDIWNALQRIDSAAVFLPTFEVRHEGGIEAVTQNIVDAITALHPAPSHMAVMQQALDALRAVRSNMQKNAPHLSGKVWGDADAAITALTAIRQLTDEDPAAP